MTTIIAVETPKKVTFGWDRQITLGWRKVAGEDKVFTNNSIVFGCSGALLAANILRHAELPNPAHAGWDIDRWMTRELLPAINTALTGRAATTVNSGKVETSGSTLVAVHGRIYHISSDLSWMRASDGIYAIGSGSEYALGALATGSSIAKALTIAHRFDSYTGPDHGIATTATLLTNTTNPKEQP
ncbi:MAG: hypothetical protein ABJB03_00460 [Rhodoglobus sp.]